MLSHVARQLSREFGSTPVRDALNDRFGTRGNCSFFLSFPLSRLGCRLIRTVSCRHRISSSGDTSSHLGRAGSGSTWIRVLYIIPVDRRQHSLGRDLWGDTREGNEIARPFATCRHGDVEANRARGETTRDVATAGTGCHSAVDHKRGKHRALLSRNSHSWVRA
jgi:hypothetical protein